MTSTEKLAKCIVRTPRVCGGLPRIEGHRIRVRDVGMWFEALRMSANEIANQYDLALSDIYLALAYFHANQQELQEEWDLDNAYLEQIVRGSFFPEIKRGSQSRKLRKWNKEKSKN